MKGSTTRIILCYKQNTNQKSSTLGLSSHLSAPHHLDNTCLEQWFQKSDNRTLAITLAYCQERSQATTERAGPRWSLEVCPSLADKLKIEGSQAARIRRVKDQKGEAAQRASSGDEQWVPWSPAESSSAPACEETTRSWERTSQRIRGNKVQSSHAPKNVPSPTSQSGAVSSELKDALTLLKNA